MSMKSKGKGKGKGKGQNIPISKEGKGKGLPTGKGKGDSGTGVNIGNGMGMNVSGGKGKGAIVIPTKKSSKSSMKKSKKGATMARSEGNLEFEELSSMELPVAAAPGDLSSGSPSAAPSRGLNERRVRRLSRARHHNEKLQLSVDGSYNSNVNEVRAWHNQLRSQQDQ